MIEDQLRELIRQTLRDMVGPQRRRALVVFTGGLLGFDEAIRELRYLRESGIELDYVQTPSAQRILDQNTIASVGMVEVSNKLVEEHQMLIAPTLTSNIAAKVAHGVADCLASNLFSEFLMGNRLVVASRTAICPDGSAKKSWFPHMPAGYADMLRSNLSALDSFGVRLVDAPVMGRVVLAAWERTEREHRAPLLAALGVSPGHVAAAVPTAGDSASEQTIPAAIPTTAVVCDQSLISQKVIAGIADNTAVHILPTAKVTAMAKDLAASRSIRIIREV